MPLAHTPAHTTRTKAFTSHRSQPTNPTTHSPSSRSSRRTLSLTSHQYPTHNQPTPIPTHPPAGRPARPRPSSLSCPSSAPACAPGRAATPAPHPGRPEGSQVVGKHGRGGRAGAGTQSAAMRPSSSAACDAHFGSAQLFFAAGNAMQSLQAAIGQGADRHKGAVALQAAVPTLADAGSRVLNLLAPVLPA